MKLEKEELSQLHATVFGHATLLQVLKKYRYPNDKIKKLIDNGTLIALKKGFYVLAAGKNKLALETIANSLYGPSYISMEYALAFYQMIPEKVVTITSLSCKRSKHYETPLARFEYIHTTLPYYSQGIRLHQLPNGISFLIASKEKALCDQLTYTKNLQISSQKAMQEYLEKDLRLDMQILNGFDINIIKACIASVAYKKRQLEILLKFVEALL